MMYNVDALQAIDIDTSLDFVTAESVHEAGLVDVEDANDILTYEKYKKDLGSTLLLDCTVRDGGYTNNWNFSDDFVIRAYEAVSASGMDYFEVRGLSYLFLFFSL
jgi:hypothetical protein